MHSAHDSIRRLFTQAVPVLVFVILALGSGVSAAPRASGDTTALGARASDLSEAGGASSTRPLLGTLLYEAGADAPGHHFGFLQSSSQAQTTGTRRAIQPDETPPAVPRTPLAVFQTAVARRAIQPNETPPAVPRTPISVTQTLVTLQTVLPGQTAAAPRSSLSDGQAAAQRAIPAGATPGAVPRTPLAAYQTAVAQPAIRPDQAPNAVPGRAAVLSSSPTATPTVVSLLPGRLP